MNYQQIVDNLNEEKIRKLLEKLEIPYIDKGDFLVCKTGCHNQNIEEASWKLYYYKNNHFFYCYTECQGMSVFKFLEHYYEARGIEWEWFKDIYNVVLDCSNFETSIPDGFAPIEYHSLKERYKKRDKLKELPVYPIGILDMFMKNYPVEWLNDGISRRAMDKYSIKYSVSQNKIIIPHFNVNNELVGIRGRALDDWEIENVGKYMPIQIEKKWYSHPLSLNLYGLNQNKENIKKYGVCYIGESEKFCLQLESFRFPNCSCAVCGSQFNKFQLNLLLKECRPQEVIICFDKEEKEGEDKYFNKLYSLCKKYRNYCKMSFIYDKDNLLQLKQSPSDCGEKTFKKLLESRVIVR